MGEEKEGKFSRRGELFRRLITEDYQFMDAARINSRFYENAVVGSEDIKVPTKLMRLMTTTPKAMVNFSNYGLQKAPEITNENQILHSDGRSRNFRTRLARYPPLEIWSRWVLNTPVFSGLMVITIVLNAIVIIIEGELPDTIEMKPYRLAIDTMDFTFLAVFLVDIFFKLIDNGKNFWYEAWNIFDFLVTLGSFAGAIIDIIYQDSETGFHTILQTAHYVRVLRIFRLLNVVTRWKRIRLLWIAIANTVKSLIYILILMFMFFFIFALIAIQVFDRFTQSHIKDLDYHQAFQHLGTSIVTLFQLFTLDHWYKLIVSLMRVMSFGYPIIFCLCWILLGSFIFRNIFMGVMVNNFQNIRRELTEGEENAQQKRPFGIDLNLLGLDEFQPVLSSSEKDSMTDYESNVFHHLEILRTLGDGNASPMLIPRDTLLQYFIILEAISKNLDERERILQLLNQSVIDQYSH